MCIFFPPYRMATGSQRILWGKRWRGGKKKEKNRKREPPESFSKCGGVGGRKKKSGLCCYCSRYNSSETLDLCVSYAVFFARKCFRGCREIFVTPGENARGTFILIAAIFTGFSPLTLSYCYVNRSDLSTSTSVSVVAAPRGVVFAAPPPGRKCRLVVPATEKKNNSILY